MMIYTYELQQYEAAEREAKARRAHQAHELVEDQRKAEKRRRR